MWIGVAVLWSYYLVTLFALPVMLRAWTGLPLEIVRKQQHVAYALSVFLLLGLFDAWYEAVAAGFGLVVVAYPVLAWWEGRRSYRRLLTDRRRHGGGLRRQMLYVQASFALLIALFWGGLGPTWRPVIAVGAMAWGFGDAAAALVGKWLGRHRVGHPAIDGGKTYEGSAAMVATAVVAVFLTLLWYGGWTWAISLTSAVLVGPVAGVVELFSRRGIDTLTVPVATALTLTAWRLLATTWGW